MFCPNCGSKAPDGAKFCGVCGTPLPHARVEGSASSQQQVTQAAVRPAQQAAPQPAMQPAAQFAPQPAPAPAAASAAASSGGSVALRVVGIVAVVTLLAVAGALFLAATGTNVPLVSSLLSGGEFQGTITVSSDGASGIGGFTTTIDGDKIAMSNYGTDEVEGTVSEKYQRGTSTVYEIDETDGASISGTDGFTEATAKVMVPQGIGKGEPRGMLGYVVRGGGNGGTGIGSIYMLVGVYFDFHADGTVDIGVAGAMERSSSALDKADPTLDAFDPSDSARTQAATGTWTKPYDGRIEIELEGADGTLYLDYE